MILKIKHLSLVASVLLMYTGCGSDSNKTAENSATTTVSSNSVLDSSINKNLSLIIQYANDNTQVKPTVGDYKEANIKGINSINIEFINKILTNNNQNLDTREDVQKIIDESIKKANIAKAIIKKYSNQDDSPYDKNVPTSATSNNDSYLEIPTLETYSDTWIKNVNKTNLNLTNKLVQNEIGITDKNFILKIQQLVNNAGFKSTVSMSIMKDFIKNKHNKPSLNDYFNIGIIGVNELNIDPINRYIVNQTNLSDKIDKIQVIVNNGLGEIENAFLKIKNYASTDNNPLPTLNTYLNAGIKGVTNRNLDAINNIIKKSGITEIRSIVMLQRKIDNSNGELRKVLTKMKTFNRSNSITLTADDYNKLGIEGVNENTLIGLNRVMKICRIDDISTVAKVRNIARITITNANSSFNKIQHYTPNNNLYIPTTQDYINLGIKNINKSYISAINDKVIKINKSEVDSVAKIQSLINDVNDNAKKALTKIKNLAQNDDAQVPTLDDYQKLGFNKINNLILGQVNNRVKESDSIDILNINYIIDGAIRINAENRSNSLNTIINYSSNPNNPKPRKDDYAYAWIGGVDDDNLDAINKAISQSSNPLNNFNAINVYVENAINAINLTITKFAKYAVRANAEAPTLEDYGTLGLVSIDSDMLDAVNNEILKSGSATNVSITTINDIMGIINNVDSVKFNAYKYMVRYINDNEERPTLAIYKAIDGTIEQDYVRLLNIRMPLVSEVLTYENIKSVINAQIGFMNAFRNKARESSNSNNRLDIINLTDYNRAGFIFINSDNLDAANANLASGIGLNADTTFDTIENILRLGIGVQGRSLLKIQNYATLDEISDRQIPNKEDYKNLSITGVNDNNIYAINLKIKQQTSIKFVNKILKIVRIVQNVISEANNALNKIRSYSSDNISSVPTLDDYKKAGILGVTSSNLNAINRLIKKSTNSTSDILSIQTVVNQGVQNAIGAFNLIANYADYKTLLVPTLETYTDAGVIGMTENNLYAINHAIDLKDKADIISLDNLQFIVDEAVGVSRSALLKIQNYSNDNQVNIPVLEDYLNAGIDIDMIDNTIIFLLNKQVRGVASNFKTTISQIEGLLETAKSYQEQLVTDFQNYARNNNSTIPTLEKYQDIGVLTINATVLDAINAKIKSCNPLELNSIENIRRLANNELVRINGIIDKIMNYVRDHTRSKPTKDDYVAVGIAVSNYNDLYVLNEKINRNTEFGDIADIHRTLKNKMAHALTIVQNYTHDQSIAPSIFNYLDLAISNVTDYTRYAVNKEIEKSDSNYTKSIDNIILLVNKGLMVSNIAFEKIQDYVQGKTTAPTYDDYRNAGFANITRNIVSKINKSLTGKAISKDNVRNIIKEKLVNSDLSLLKIAEYANDNAIDPAVPTLEDYLNIEYDKMNENLLFVVNRLVKRGQRHHANTILKVKHLIDKGIDIQNRVLDKIRNYKTNRYLNPKPTLDDYRILGLNNLMPQNLYAINSLIKSSITMSDLDTIEKIKEKVGYAVYQSADALRKIKNFAGSSNNSVSLTLHDYKFAGFTNVDNINIYTVTEQIQSDTTSNKTFDTLQTVVETGISKVQIALDKIKTYNASNDPMTPKPVANDYFTLGLDNISDYKVNAVNTLIYDDTSLINSTNPFKHIRRNMNYAVSDFNNVLDIANAYSINKRLAPMVDDYLVAGVAGIGRDNGVLLNILNSLIGEKNYGEINSGLKLHRIVDNAQEIIETIKNINNIIESTAFSTLNAMPSISNAIADNNHAYRVAAEKINSNVDLYTLIKKIKNMVDVVNAEEIYIKKIAKYIDDGGIDYTLTIEDYKKAGIRYVNKYNIEYINYTILGYRGYVITKKSIQDVVNGVARPYILPTGVKLTPQDSEWVVASMYSMQYRDVQPILGTLNTSTRYRIEIHYESDRNVELSAYRCQRKIMTDATYDNEENLRVTFWWDLQFLNPGTNVFSAFVTIEDGSITDGKFQAKPLELNSDSMVAVEIPYPIDNAASDKVGTFRIRIIPAVKDRNFDKQDNKGRYTHKFVYVPIYDPLTTRTWLNLNLGSAYASVDMASIYGTNCKTDITKLITNKLDRCAYGSKLQWGRKADGHELMKYNNDWEGGRYYNETTDQKNPNPNHVKFITGNGLSSWAGTADISSNWSDRETANNPCPIGYRVPTQAEWRRELNGINVFIRRKYNNRDAVISYSDAVDPIGKNFLRLPMAGYVEEHGRFRLNNDINKATYWTSTVNTRGYLDHQNRSEKGGWNKSSGFYKMNDLKGKTLYEFMLFKLHGNRTNYGFEGSIAGMSVRCIKDK